MRKKNWKRKKWENTRKKYNESIKKVLEYRLKKSINQIVIEIFLKKEKKRKEYQQNCYRNISEEIKEMKREYKQKSYKNLCNGKKDKVKENGRKYCKTIKSKLLL